MAMVAEDAHSARESFSSISAVGNAVLAIIELLAAMVIFGKTLDHVITAARTNLHKLSKTYHPGDNFRGGGVFYLTRAFFGDNVVNGKYFNEKTF